MTDKRNILLLSGTREARELAAVLVEDPSFAVTASLAGATSAPADLRVETRTGGFGGVSGLAGFLSERHIHAVVDATHPFAQQMSGNAAQACRKAGVPLVRLERPPWQPGPGAQWIDAATLEEAANRIPAGARVFLAVGRQGLESFTHRDDVWFLVRTWEPAPGPSPVANGKVVHGPPGVREDEERDLIAGHAISHLVCRNSGGPARAKLEAAASMGIPVIMVRRPHLAEAQTVPDVASALEWLRAQA